jgi:adenine-specific DNA-methyltransferase
MCKLEGFRYAPDRAVFWNHGYSTERDFIYVTTQNLSREPCVSTSLKQAS